MKARWSAGVVLVLGAVPISAGAAGVQDLDRVLFDRPYVEVLGASPAGVLYKVSRDDNQSLVHVSTWVKPAGGTLRWWTGPTHAITGTVKIV
ncbi:hypothetical protein [Kribbella sp. DT2]|uniref:hypothetical protein n=1 Tax=Kribbella sp. DT2 TaxID=3393427 RepID=UPI003CE9F785